MERDQEIVKLVNVLRRTARMAQQAAWAGSDAESIAYCVKQYNKVLERLIEIDEGVSSVFDPLGEDANLTVVAMACRQLAAFYEDEIASGGTKWERIYGAAFDTESFKDFWRQSAKDIEDFGEFIRENLDAWAAMRKKKE
ncbi:MAG: hypothetical protein SH809_19845 [Rhodothermales bacterium]|nr:hypothetical protein [Rhodothermales bacterium]